MERYNGSLMFDILVALYLLSRGINKFANFGEKWSLFFHIFFNACFVILILIALFGKEKSAMLTIRDFRVKRSLDVLICVFFIANIHKFGNVWDLVTYLALVFVFLIHIGFQIYLVAQKRISFRD